MFRLCLLGLLVPALAVAAPVPKPKASTLYFPVRVGDTKVIEMTSEGQTKERSEFVTHVSVTDGVYAVTIEHSRDGAPVPWTNAFEVSEKGVTLVVVGKEAEPQVKLPAQAGDTWSIGTTKPGGSVSPGKRTYTTIKEEEEIEVPAGKFTAVVVECVTEWGRGEVHTTKEWYAPGVGMVKFEIMRDGKTHTSLLKSFTPGKEEKAEPKTGERK